jgi:hypothetical protein
MFIEVFISPADILTTESTPGPPNASLVAGDVHEPIIQRPVDSFSFGWLDGIAISQNLSKPDSFFVLFRRPDEDPWSTRVPTLTFYRLEVNSTAGAEEDSPSNATGSTPYLFSEEFLTSAPLSAPTSPTYTSSSASTKLVLGNHSTALWLSPRPRESDSTGLVQMDLERREDWPSQARGVQIWRYYLGDDLVWGSFGPRRTPTETQDDDDEGRTSATDEESKTHVITRRVFNAHGDVCTAVGYDEETGRVALGRNDGYIIFLRL